MDKGSLSNIISAVVFGLGLALPAGAEGNGVVKEVLLATGMFAFSGGVTNWLAVKMLFDRIPGLVGSGVIPARFREIRSEIKALILRHFFDEEYLRRFFAEHQKDIDWKRYLKQGEGETSPVAGFVEEQWAKLTAPEVVQPMIDKQIDKLAESSIGGLLLVVGIDNVRPAVNQFVTGFVASMQDKVLAAAENAAADSDVSIHIDEELLVRDIGTHVEPLLETKLQQLHAEDVKRMMEDVMRHHLGWLIVWGNVFGGALGLVFWALDL